MTVYKHTSPNNKVYIGITSKTTQERWRYQGKGYLKNKYFYAAIQKYGWDNFSHEVLFEDLTEEEACQKECELIAFYKSNQHDFGYNIAEGGQINKGWHLSEERKRHLSEINKGKARQGHPMSEETKEKLRQINLGKTSSEATKEKISKSNTGKVRSEKFKQAVREREQSKVSDILQLDLDGAIINTYCSIQEAARQTGLTASKICAVCRGRNKTHGGFKWAYA